MPGGQRASAAPSSRSRLAGSCPRRPRAGRGRVWAPAEFTADRRSEVRRGAGLHAPAAAETIALDSLPESAQRSLRAARRVARRWPFSTGPCLRRALVGGHLIRGRRPAIRIRGGVGQRSDGSSRMARARWSTAGGPGRFCRLRQRTRNPGGERAGPRPGYRMTAQRAVLLHCGLRVRSELDLHLPSVVNRH